MNPERSSRAPIKLGATWGWAIPTMLVLLTSCGGISSDGIGETGGEGGEGGFVDIGQRDRNAEKSAILGAPSSAVTCTANNQCATGYCVDGFCCDNKCDNTCMACSAPKKGSGVDGICGSIAYDTDPDGDCPLGRCDGKNSCKFYNGISCSSAAQCLSKYCVDGFCCGNICMGQCQACSTAKKGSGINGVCGSIAAATDPDGECNPGECNGSGACNSSPQPTNPNGTTCTSAAQCASGYCADGVCCDSWCLGNCQACTAAKKGSGSDGTCGNIANDADPDEECWGGACDGSGICKQYNGVPCTGTAQCLSGYCVDGFCCGNICNQLCQACSEAKKGQGFDGVCAPIVAGRDVEDECNPGECNGSGTCNQAQTPQSNGTQCVSGGQCASGNCVDGVCCDTACGSKCMACSAAKKGQGPDGTCGAIASELDPDNECNGGRCDGQGLCRYYNGAPCASAGQCFSTYCVDGFCCGNVCTGACQACSNAKKGSGYDGVCGNVATNTDPDAECNPGECNGSGACNQPQAQQPDGAACTQATQCISGFCVDGVCCNGACPLTCEACSAAKKGQGADGTCGPMLAGTDPENECPNAECSGSSACNTPQSLPNGTTCAVGAECASGNCVDGLCCDTSCVGTCVACSAVKKGSGTDGVCGAIAYDTDPDDECYGGGCSGSGLCAAYNGVPCAGNTQCLSGWCVDGVCCNNHCGDACYACTAAKKGSGYDGVCSFIGADSDPDNECVNGECNGAGQCAPTKYPNGTACTSAAGCLSGHCVDDVCCDVACEDTCYACTATKKGQGSDGTCGPIKNDTDPANECASGACNGNGACGYYNGVPTPNSTECLSNYSVDGVCCGNICNGPCQACSAAKKGSGIDGVCGSIAAGTDPDLECSGSSCNGSGFCAPIACTAGTQCPSGACSNGYCLRDYTQIETGYGVSCVLTALGRVKCWGQNNYGQLGQGDTNIRGDNPGEMGANLPPINLGTGVLAKQITIGGAYVCALTTLGAVRCWGRNDTGQLGRGDLATTGDGPNEMGDNLISVNLGAGKTAKQISAGGRHMCALLNDNTVKCWGYNTEGQLGLGTNISTGWNSSNTPASYSSIPFGAGKSVLSVSAGDSHSCVVLNDGGVKCWGANYVGNLGIPNSTQHKGDNPNEMGDTLLKIDLGTGKIAVEVSAGYLRSCARFSDNTAKCWGYNSVGECGQGHANHIGDNSNELGNNLPPINMGTGKYATKIKTATIHTCAMLNDGSIKCWGANFDAELGLGIPSGDKRGDAPNEMGDYLNPVNVGTGKQVLDFFAGGNNTCVILNDGNVKCWGYNRFAELGLGDTNARGFNVSDMGDNLPALSLY